MRQGMRVARWLAPGLLCCALLLAGCGAAQGGGASVTPGTGGLVTVATDQPTYTVGQTLGVTVHNGLGAPIYAFDTRSGCTILDLQVEQQGQWTTASAARCPMGRPTRLVTIAPGSDYTARIAANQFGLATQALAPGTYRLALSYLLTSRLTPPTTPTTIYSSTVTIVGTGG